MASTRAERMQQRLRGAQRRQIKDVDFGFVVDAVPPEAVAEAGASPPPLSAQIFITASPEGLQRVKTPLADAPTKTHRSADANISAKRRKLNTDKASSIPTVRTRSQEIPVDIYDIPVDEPSKPLQAEPTNDPAEQLIEANSHDAAFARETEGLDPRSAGVSTSKQLPRTRRKSKPIVNQSQSELAIDSQVHSRQGSTRRRSLSFQKGAASSEPIGVRLDSADADDIDELSPEQPNRRFRGSDAPAKTADKQNRNKTDDLAESIGDHEAATLLKRNGGKEIHLARVEQRASAENTDLQPAEKMKRRERPQVASPAIQSQPRKVAGNKRAKVTTKSRRNTTQSEAVPVAVQRLTRGLVYDGQEIDADILNVPAQQTKRSGVNAVDVLRQICHEMIGHTLDILQEGGENAANAQLKREYKTKWRAVEGFGRELQLRLLEHTINLDNTYALEKRVRDAHKTKLSLREDVLRVRAEREQLALRMDQVRIKHEDDMREAQERNALNTIAQDIEVAVERGKEGRYQGGPVGTKLSNSEFAIKRLASQISAKGSSMGTLGEIQQFNSFLQRAALALEGRGS